jgi:NADH-quinone oxidoreductase subunit A
LRDPGLPLAVATADGAGVELAAPAATVLRELGVPNPQVADPAQSPAANTAALRDTASTLALTAILDILVFFGVLLVGFAYVWRRGDLDWVRAITQSRPARAGPTASTTFEREPALV